MYLIAGLGTPGSKYVHSRHNVGFDVVEVLSQRHNIPLKKSKCRATIGEGFINGEKVILVRPDTFMNLSGEAVSPLMQFYKVEPSHLLVIYDDIDLAEGRDDFPRLRVGIGRPPQYMDLADYVLSGYNTPELRKTMFDAFCNAADAVEMLMKEGFAKAQQFAANAGKEG